MGVLRHWSTDMPRADLIDEVETLRGRLRDADFRERGLHEALRKETAQHRGAAEERDELRDMLTRVLYGDDDGSEHHERVQEAVALLDRLGGQ